MPKKNGVDTSEWSRQVHIAINKALRGEQTQVKSAGPKSTVIILRSKDRQAAKDRVTAALEGEKIVEKKDAPGDGQVDHHVKHALSSFPATKVNLVDKTWIYIVYKGLHEGKVSTAVAESTQCVFGALAMRVNKNGPLKENEICKDDWAKAYQYCDIPQLPKDKAVKMCEQLTDEWITSNTIGANVMKQDSHIKGGPNYKFHRGSKTVNEIYKCFGAIKKANKKMHPRLDVDQNKWSPADIYLINAQWGPNNIKEALAGCKDIAVLNQQMQTWLDEKNVIGVSLKKMVGKPPYGNAKIVLKNKVGDKDNLEVKFVKLESPTNSTSGYMHIKVDNEIKRINFRNFTDAGGFSGEVLTAGGAARHGKIGHGPMNKVLQLHGLGTIDENNPGRAKAHKSGKWMRTTMNKLGFFSAGDDQQAWEDTIPQSSMNFASSKYFVLQLFEIIDPLTAKQKDALADSFYRYAGSIIPDLSAPYLKMS